MSSETVVKVFVRWGYAQSAEGANYAFAEFCEVLDLQLPDSATHDTEHPGYVSQRAAPLEKLAWPKPLAERVRVVEVALGAKEKPVKAKDLGGRFARAMPGDIPEILHTFVTPGRARPGDAKGTFVK